jgi:hypothetical protein
VPAGGGIPAFNGLHTGGNKPFEQEMNLLIEIGIFDGDADLMTKRDEILEIVIPELFAMFMINGLEHTQKMAMSRDRHTDHIARDKSAGLIHMTEETGILLDIVDDDGLSGSSDMSRYPLPLPETGLANGLSLLAMDHIEIQITGGFIQQEKGAGFGIHQERGGFDGALANGRVIETRIQQSADFLKLSQ